MFSVSCYLQLLTRNRVLPAQRRKTRCIVGRLYLGVCDSVVSSYSCTSAAGAVLLGYKRTKNASTYWLGQATLETAPARGARARICTAHPTGPLELTKDT